MRLAILIVSLLLAMTANAQFPSASYPPIKSSSSANGIGYVPANSANWISPPPTLVSAALDSLASYLTSVSATSTARSAVLGTARKYVSAVASYTALAQAAQLDPIAALELRSNLSLMVTASEAVIADLLNDPTAVDQCDVMDEVDAIILSHSACIELYDALNGEGVFPEQVQVTGSQSLIQWCAARYGGPAAERYAEIIERMNDIPDVGWLQPNTVILAPAKKVL